jgi:Flp pilus assembly protein TadG
MIRYFLHSKCGNVTLETALILPVLLGFLAVICESPLLLFGQANVSRLSRSAADFIRFNEDKDINQAALKQNLCSAILPPFSCTGNRLILQVAPLNQLPTTRTADVFILPSGQEPVAIRVIYRWPTLFPVALLALGSRNGTVEIDGTAVVNREKTGTNATPVTSGGLIWN